MSENKELLNSYLPANENPKSDISVTVKRNSENSDEIDLVNVFKFMGKKSGIFVTLILLLATIGLAAALFMAEHTKSHSDAVASIQVLYGKDYSVESISSAYVVKNALSQSGLSGRLSVDSVRNNIVVSRVLKEEYRQKLEMYSGLNLSVNDINAILGMEPEYEDTYIVTLKNGFGEKATRIKDSELTALLNGIIYQFNESFFDEYSNITAPEYGIGGFDYSLVEYAQAVTILKQSFDALGKYCNDLSVISKNFSRDGLTFKDMSELIDLSYKAQANYFEAYVFYTNTVRDKENFNTIYTSYIRNYKTNLLAAQNTIKHYDNIIKNYKNETILIISGNNDKEQQSIIKNLDAYNALVLQQAENYREKAVYERMITDYEERLKNIQSVGAIGVHDYAELTVTSIIDVYDKLYNDVTEMAESFMESSGYQGSFISFTTADLNNASFFSAANIKKAAIGLVGGAFIGVVVWGVYGLVIELKRSNKKREEAKNE